MKKKTKTKTKTKKTYSATRLSQKVYKRDFCSHVFANPDRGGGGGTRETSPAAKSEEKRMFSQVIQTDMYVCISPHLPRFQERPSK